MKAWIFQEKADVQKRGQKAAPWCCGWYEPDGRRRKKKFQRKTAAEAHKRKVEREIELGTYAAGRQNWAEFRVAFEAKVLALSSTANQNQGRSAFNHFERNCKPRRLDAITTETADAYAVARLGERGKKRGSTTSRETVNKKLRYIKAALSTARDWGLIARRPPIRRLKTDERIGKVVTAEHLEAIFEACDVATKPEGLPYDPSEWWRALLLFAATTGRRIGEIIAFRRDDIDFASGAILTRAVDNKGKRDAIDRLPAAVVAEVKAVSTFRPELFYWPQSERRLLDQFHAIQQAAGIHLPCPDEGTHDCDVACHLYGFHAMRRMYATVNAARLPAPVLQHKMRHKSFATTQRYLKMAEMMTASAEDVFVPTVKRRTGS